MSSTIEFLDFRVTRLPDRLYFTERLHFAERREGGASLVLYAVLRSRACRLSTAAGLLPHHSDILDGLDSGESSRPISTAYTLPASPASCAALPVACSCCRIGLLNIMGSLRRESDVSHIYLARPVPGTVGLASVRRRLYQQPGALVRGRKANGQKMQKCTWGFYNSTQSHS